MSHFKKNSLKPAKQELDIFHLLQIKPKPKFYHTILFKIIPFKIPQGPHLSSLHQIHSVEGAQKKSTQIIHLKNLKSTSPIEK